MHTCSKCNKQLPPVSITYASTLGYMDSDGFHPNVNEPWENVLCPKCYDKKYSQNPETEILITVKGGVIQYIDRIPNGYKVTVIDYDTVGIPPEELSMFDENEAIITTWKNKTHR